MFSVNLVTGKDVPGAIARIAINISYPRFSSRGLNPPERESVLPVGRESDGYGVSAVTDLRLGPPPCEDAPPF